MAILWLVYSWLMVSHGYSKRMLEANQRLPFNGPPQSSISLGRSSTVSASHWKAVSLSPRLLWALLWRLFGLMVWESLPMCPIVTPMVTFRGRVAGGRSEVRFFRGLGWWTTRAFCTLILRFRDYLYGKDPLSLDSIGWAILFLLDHFSFLYI